MTQPLQGRVAVVTGAGGDVGGAAAILFAERGAQVVGVDINEAGLEALRDRMPAGAPLTTVKADVSMEAEVQAYVAGALDAHGRIDIFFNNAGTEGLRTGAWCPLTELPVEDFRYILAVNARGVFLGLKHVIPAMVRGGGGAIVNTSSIYGLKGSPNQIAYVASKHAVRAMTISAGREWAASGVRINAIAPGAIEGRMLRDFVALIEEAVTPEQAEAMAHAPAPPLPRWSDPKEIAAVAAFLCSDEASYITGACYSVDGGLSAM